MPVHDPGNHGEELAAFGGWFASGRFNEAWALGHLQQVIEHVGKADPISEVLDALSSIASRHPRDATVALRGLVEGDREPWIPLVHGEDLRAILGAAIRSGSAQAAEVAREVVNRLAARGHHEFRDLLETAPPRGEE